MTTSRKLLCFVAAAIALGCNGRLDVGDETHEATKLSLARGPAVVALGTGHGCAILEDSTVACWGFNRYGQTGVPPEDSLDPTGDPYILAPVRVPGLTDIVQISSDWQETYALRADGKVFGWGATRWSREPSDEGVPSNVPKQVPGVSDVVKVADGGGPACALRRDGTVICWGSNSYKSVGVSSVPENTSPITEILPPTPVAGITDAIDITVSDCMACVRHRDGDVSCWGRVQLLADEYTMDSPVPVKIPGVHHAVEVALAQSTAIALLEDGTVMGWGDSDDQTALLAKIHGPRDPRVTSYDSGVPPAPFPGLSGILSVHAQYRTMCALEGSGRVLCWGRNDVGELGQGRTTIPITEPTPIDGVVAARIAVGTWNSCAIQEDRSLVCWGGGSSGALGTGNEEKYAAKPAKVLLPAPLAEGGPPLP